MTLKPKPQFSDGFKPEKPELRTMISGGQTGVDRAALDVAIALSIAHAGWCPFGRRAEDGIIPERYHLRETESEHYAVRTRRNIIEAEATLILYGKKLEGGTLLTKRLAMELRRPMRCQRLAGRVSSNGIREWLLEQKIKTLNVAGPRASKEPAIYRQAFDFLMQLLG
jgi:hypothetical protein